MESSSVLLVEISGLEKKGGQAGQAGHLILKTQYVMPAKQADIALFLGTGTSQN